MCIHFIFEDFPLAFLYDMEHRHHNKIQFHQAQTRSNVTPLKEKFVIFPYSSNSIEINICPLISSWNCYIVFYPLFQTAIVEKPKLLEGMKFGKNRGVLLYLFFK